MANKSASIVQGLPFVSPIIERWTDVTAQMPQPTGLGTGAGTYFSYKYRRIGDSAEIEFLYTKDPSNGSGAAAVYFPLPPGLTGVLSILSGSGQTLYVGHTQPVTSNWAAVGHEYVVGSGIRFWHQGTAGVITGAQVLATAQFRFRATVQISGWDTHEAIGAGVSATGPSLVGNGIESGSFTAAVTGPFPANTTTTVYWARNGNVSTISMPTLQVNATVSSGVITIDMSSLPARLRPKHQIDYMGIDVINSGSDQGVGILRIPTTGNFSVFRGYTTPAWATGAGAGWAGYSISYPAL